MDAQNEKLEAFTKEKNFLKEMKNTITEVKNTLEGTNHTLNIQRDESVSQKTAVEIITTNGKMKRNEDDLRVLRVNIAYTNIHNTGVPNGEERKMGLRKIVENIVMENLARLGKATVTQDQEAQSPIQDEPTSRDIVIKMIIIKDKDRILKVVRKNKKQ